MDCADPTYRTLPVKSGILAARRKSQSAMIRRTGSRGAPSTGRREVPRQGKDVWYEGNDSDPFDGGARAGGRSRLLGEAVARAPGADRFAPGRFQRARSPGAGDGAGRAHDLRRLGGAGQGAGAGQAERVERIAGPGVARQRRAKGALHRDASVAERAVAARERAPRAVAHVGVGQPAEHAGGHNRQLRFRDLEPARTVGRLRLSARYAEG